MVKIVQTLTEQMPALKLIGKKYTEKDCNASGIFSDKWDEWFRNGWFDKLCADCAGIQGISDDFIGLCECDAQGFTYWIGILMAPDDAVPDGFEARSLPAGKLFVAYVYGNEQSGELYGEQATDAFFRELKEQGFQPAHQPMLERYHCPRFTQPDDKGNVILDYCVYIEA